TMMYSTFVGLALLAASAAHAAPPAEIFIPGERIFPESMTATRDGHVIIGGFVTGAIYRAAPGAAKAEPWIAPGTHDMHSVLGVFADDASHTLWACSASPDAANPPPSALYAFDLNSGAFKARYPMPKAGAMCNDIAIGPDGT